VFCQKNIRGIRQPIMTRMTVRHIPCAIQNYIYV
jgi:hypothetical protein